jgi:hypothetical protein
MEGSSVSQETGFKMSQVNEENTTSLLPSANSFEGNVISVTGVTLVTTSMQGKEYSHTLAKDARLTCDGTDCNVEDLKVGSKIRVTTSKDDQNVATGVESLDKNSEFTHCCG